MYRLPERVSKRRSLDSTPVRIEPVSELVGHLVVPGDKSISHRAVLVGAVAEGETRVTGFGRSADTESTIGAVRALGVEVVEDDVDELRVRGRGLRGLEAPGEAIDCQVRYQPPQSCATKA